MHVALRGAKVKRVFGTLFLNCDSVIQIYNHWVPLKKKMFSTHNLSED
jgi:hypothetical protein